MLFLKERGVCYIIYLELKKLIIFFGKYVKKILCEKRVLWIIIDIWMKNKEKWFNRVIYCYIINVYLNRFKFYWNYIYIFLDILIL